MCRVVRHPFAHAFRCMCRVEMNSPTIHTCSIWWMIMNLIYQSSFQVCIIIYCKIIIIQATQKIKDISGYVHTWYCYYFSLPYKLDYFESMRSVAALNFWREALHVLSMIVWLVIVFEYAPKEGIWPYTCLISNNFKALNKLKYSNTNNIILGIIHYYRALCVAVFLNSLNLN